MHAVAAAGATVLNIGVFLKTPRRVMCRGDVCAYVNVQMNSGHGFPCMVVNEMSATRESGKHPVGCGNNCRRVDGHARPRKSDVSACSHGMLCRCAAGIRRLLASLNFCAFASRRL